MLSKRRCKSPALGPARRPHLPGWTGSDDNGRDGRRAPPEREGKVWKQPGGGGRVPLENGGNPHAGPPGQPSTADSRVSLADISHSNVSLLEYMNI